MLEFRCEFDGRNRFKNAEERAGKECWLLTGDHRNSSGFEFFHTFLARTPVCLLLCKNPTKFTTVIGIQRGSLPRESFDGIKGIRNGVEGLDSRPVFKIVSKQRGSRWTALQRDAHQII